MSRRKSKLIARPLNCNLCQAEFLLKSELTQHLKTVHEEEEAEKIPICDINNFETNIESKEPIE